MEQITGRIVWDAEIKRTKSDKELVAFRIAVNDRYKPKNGDVVERTRYFDCAYFISTKIKDVLRKGSIVTVFGRIDLNAYKKNDGEYKATLVVFATHIDLIGIAKKGTAEVAAVGAATKPESKDDLPF